MKVSPEGEGQRVLMKVSRSGKISGEGPEDVREGRGGFQRGSGAGKWRKAFSGA